MLGRGRVDAGRAVRFTFDGAPIDAFAGDTIASALLANGLHLVGRSFKYHRPRGILTAGSEEPNALVGVARGGGRFTPNVRATVQEAVDGLEVTSQNRWPSLRHDLGVVNDRLSPLLGAGFYYKTFMWPGSFWDRVYEPLIRRAAGLGRAPRERDPDSYAACYAHCDVLVVGAGPAGLAAALAAGRSGARVILADEGSELGGSLLATPSATIDGAPAFDFVDRAAAELATLANVTVLNRTTAIAYDHENMVGLVERRTDHLAAPPDGVPRELLWRVRATRVVLAQGGIERPLVFDGNDRPGVMLAGAAQTYLNRYGVLVGRRVVVATTHNSAWHAAFDLADAGVATLVADMRAAVPEWLLAQASEHGIEVLTNAVPTATRGRHRVSAVRLLAGGSARWVPCDALLMSGGWTPTLHLWSHTRGTVRWDGARFLPDRPTEACRVAGANGGAWGLAAALTEGAQAGADAATDAGFRASASPLKVEYDHEGGGDASSALPSDRPAKKAFVDFQNDVTVRDIRLAVTEGMRSIEHVKRYTTNGMATDQGKLSGLNGLVIAADALGVNPPEVGLTTFRPPYTPTTFATLAGIRRGATFDPERRTVIDPWAEARGAVFEPVGQWRRARHFPRDGETMDEAVARECRTTRAAAGLFDASTLGKIEVVGPDAAEFLNRMYTNPLLKLGVGRCRYALLLGDDGFIRDDGVIARLGEDRFHVTTTTGGAARVLATMEDYLQTEWSGLDVWLTSTTEHWATIAVNGPRARGILAPHVEGLDLAADAFAHMSVATCRVCGVPARLFRVSFTGEVGFEVNVPSGAGLAVWQALVAAGEAHGATVYGTEAMHVMRAEKGYIIVGQDTDGTVTPHDAGLSWAIGRKKADFVGMRALARPGMVKPDRRQLVGLATQDPSVVLEEGAQVVADPAAKVPARMIGHVTSAYGSDAVGRSIALALVEGGHRRAGERLFVPMEARTHAVTVVPTVALDPDGTRLDG
ncbi:sarcosine oxidase subunit alpha family protein [Acuticoccus sp.]|uniref:sarcosine oxidase subunit alpha family protein n=1 Tax=Acuticoccus sp. TaxID=1904378 RepID=UPI003B52B17B